MKSWLITEDEIREIVGNCDEICESRNSDSLHKGESCIIRSKYNDNPIWKALYIAVDSIPNTNALDFVHVFRRELQRLLHALDDKDYKVDRILNIKILEKAIEVESK